MIHYEHDDAWKNNLDQALITTIRVLQNFGAGKTKDIPSHVSKDIKDESSDYHRFLEAFYDETLLDAELSHAADVAGNTKDSYIVHDEIETTREANRHRFIDVVHAAVLYCRMAADDGVEFTLRINEKLNSSFAHFAFLEEFYDTVMINTRLNLLSEEGKNDPRTRFFDP